MATMIGTEKFLGADTLSRLNALFTFDAGRVDELLEPDFRRYFSSSFGAGKLLDYGEEANEYLRLANWRGPVLDFACGYGVMSICLRAAGVEEVVGTDIREIRIQACSRLAEWVGCGGLKFVAGDTRLEFPQGFFGGILVKDALSHLSFGDPFLRNAFRVLRPGGVLLISEDRNGLNPRTQLATRRLWSICESGEVSKVSCYGLKDNWRNVREAYLREHFPQLSTTQCRQFAVAGRGYTNIQLGEVITAKLKRSHPLKPSADCVDPITGIVQERLINPLALVRELRSIGFHVSIAPPRRWQSDVAGRILKDAWPLSMPAAPYFYVIARKPRTNGHA